MEEYKIKLILLLYRLELMEWVNTKLVDNYQDITQLKDGIACCLLTEMMYNDVYI